MKITNDVKYIGVNDRRIDLFEGQYPVPEGMAYNSYVIIDEQIAVLDTVDIGFTDEWLQNLEIELNGRQPDYLIIQHMEPDHSASIARFISKYPGVKIVATARAFPMIPPAASKTPLNLSGELLIASAAAEESIAVCLARSSKLNISVSTD